MTKKDKLKQKLTAAGIEYGEGATEAQLKSLLAESLLPVPTKEPKEEKEPEVDVEKTEKSKQVPLALCNKYALFVASELKKQRAQAILDNAKAIVKASKKE